MLGPEVEPDLEVNNTPFGVRCLNRFVPKAREPFYIDDEPIVLAFAIPHLEQTKKDGVSTGMASRNQLRGSRVNIQSV